MSWFLDPSHNAQLSPFEAITEYVQHALDDDYAAVAQVDELAENVSIIFRI